jgi:hypothetical protein
MQENSGLIIPGCQQLSYGRIDDLLADFEDFPQSDSFKPHWC